MDITQSYLKSVLHYDPDTGVFTWIKRVANRVKIGDSAGSLSLGYQRIAIKGRLYMAHRLAFVYMTGKFPENETDHINGVPNDNRWANLRAVTGQENLKNKKRYAVNTSGVTGVYWKKQCSKWAVQIRISGKNTHIGYFADKDDAVAARKAAEVTGGFHPNHGMRL